MILAIVLGIAVPGVLGIIHRAQKNAFKQSAGMLLETGRIYYGQRKMDRNSIKDQESFYFPETTELEYSGEKPQDGYLTIYEDGSQYIEITNGTYCAYGDQASDINVKDGVCQDQTPGVLAGTGIERDPYKIESIEDLVQFGKNVDEGNTYENKYVTLEKSLDFKNEKSYVNSNRTDYGDINENGIIEPLLTELTTEKGFNPIGNYISSSDNKSFYGELNGKDYRVSNLLIHRETENGIGFISRSFGTLRNVNISGNIIGNKAVGLFVALNEGKIIGVKGHGEVTGLVSHIGGMVGQNGRSTSSNVVLLKASFVGKVQGDNLVGGLIGLNNGKVTEITVDADIKGITKWIGGIAGQNGTKTNAVAKIENSRFRGTLVGKQDVGGLTGLNSGLLFDSSVCAEVTGVTEVGGAVGFLGLSGGTTGTMYNIYTTGNIDGSENVGGLVGMLVKGTLKNSYSTADITAQNDPTGSTEGAISNAVGGAIGFIGCTDCDHSLVKVENVYATGKVSGVRETGGLVGQNGASSENTKTKYLTLENGYSLGNVSGELDAIGGSIGTNIMNAKNLYAGGDVFGSTNVGNIVGRRENEDATITNVYSREGQQVVGSNVLTLGSVASLPTLSPSSWWKDTLGFDNNWKFEDGYYPLLYKVDENGNPTTELLPGQKKIPIQ